MFRSEVTMATLRVKVEDRLAALEQDVAALKARLEGKPRTTKEWLDQVSGKFANDPMYDEAMRLGREWRESQRPKPGARRKKPNGGD